MKALIADDEMLVRASLRSMIAEMQLSIDVIAEVTNGEDLIQVVKSNQVDLAIVDIKMPILSGLDAIKILSADYPDIQWIILSGHSEFTFAQQALKYGVKDYLLKPVSPEDLFGTLQKIATERNRFIQLLNMEFSSSLNDCLNDLVGVSFLSDAASSDNIFANGKFSGKLILLEGGFDVIERNKFIRDLISDIHSLINRFLSYNLGFAVCFLPSGDFIVCGAYLVKTENVDLDQLIIIENFINQLDALIKDHKHISLSISAISTHSHVDFKTFIRDIYTIQSQSDLIYLYDKSQQLTIDDLQSKAEQTDMKIRELIHETLQIANSIQDHTQIIYREHLNRLVRMYKLYPALKESEVIDVLRRILYHIPELQDSKVICFEDLLNLLSGFQEKVHSQVQVESHTSVNHLVNQAIQYTLNNYSKDIGIAQIAYELNLTPNYLSTLFRKVTKENYVRFLTKVRLKKARDLLLLPNSQVNQVSEQVGYQSARYFTKLYKEFYGVYPSEHMNH